jgi:hypothetical protein
MKRGAYIHVGCRKSGTSALQAAIRGSVEEMSEQGLGMPLAERVDHYNGILTPLTSFGEDEEVPPRVHKAMRRLVSTMSATQGSRLLLTMEDLAELSARRAAVLVDALKEEFDVHVIITARDWARQIPSEWQQDVKQRSLLTYDDFVEAVRKRTPDSDDYYARQDVPGIAARWGAHLPPERVHVVAVPQARDTSRLFELFGGILDLDPSSLQNAGGRNPSLGYEQAETLRRINVALGDRLTNFRRDYRFAVRTFIYHGALRGQEGMSLRLPADMVAWCHEASAAQAKELAERGYDIVGSLDDLISPNQPETSEYAEVTDSQVAAVAVRALADLAVLRHKEVREAAAAEKAAKRADTGKRAGKARQAAAPPPAGPTERIGRRVDGVLRRIRRRMRRDKR